MGPEKGWRGGCPPAAAAFLLSPFASGRAGVVHGEVSSLLLITASRSLPTLSQTPAPLKHMADAVPLPALPEVATSQGKSLQFPWSLQHPAGCLSLHLFYFTSGGFHILAPPVSSSSLLAGISFLHPPHLPTPVVGSFLVLVTFKVLPSGICPTLCPLLSIFHTHWNVPPSAGLTASSLLCSRLMCVPLPHS